MGLALVGGTLPHGGLYAISGGAVLTAALLGISGVALMLGGALLSQAPKTLTPRTDSESRRFATRAHAAECALYGPAGDYSDDDHPT